MGLFFLSAIVSSNQLFEKQQAVCVLCAKGGEGGVSGEA